MKVLLINGSPKEHGCTYTALAEVAAELKRRDVETEILYLGKNPVPGCIDCGHCATAGRCVFEDQVNQVLARLEEIDAIVIGSPVHYSGPPEPLLPFWTVCFMLPAAAWPISWALPWFPAAGARHGYLRSAE